MTTKTAGVGASQMREVTPILAIDHLSLSFRISGQWRPVVSDVSLELARGMVVGLVGESGSGKSVTSMAVLGLNPRTSSRVDRGRVVFQGRDLLTLSPSELDEIRGDRIAMVFQDHMTSLNPALTIGEQIAEVMLRHRIADRRGASTRAIELLEVVGLPDPRRQAAAYPHLLSGGMRQRAMIAMAVACSPDVLIADEPTTALDVTVQAQVLELLKELQRTLGMAVLFVTHNLGVVADICDRVYVMYAGQIVESGAATELFESPLHPYTAAMLRSSARIELQGRELVAIRGSVPRPGEAPYGCRFAPRCDHAQSRCAEGIPPLALVEGDREVRCIRHEELRLKGVV